ncbi:MAG: 2,3-bisphosphoglycerate-independent phosphoglycerate mutase, partial [Methyloligellaceae bacterium]
TEKYAHVTYFLNGGEENPFNHEDRILVPSPKVATYDLKPEMSAPELTDELVNALSERKYDLIVINYANADMVGHTGSIDAAIRAAEVLDDCLKRVVKTLKSIDGVMLLTADHGNFEQMLDPITGGPHTAHTLNPVPALLVNGPPEIQEMRNGRLADIAPTLLRLLGIQQPPEMTGKPLY